MTTNEKSNIVGPVISQYTRAQAIEDGVLIDVTEAARETGIVYPTALTASVWERCVTVPEKTPWQDAVNRLMVVLTVLRFAIRRSSGVQEIAFTVGVQNDARGPRLVKLKALCGPDDIGEPVITIMLPHED
jgi:Family of unknown function (DUF6573)